MKPSTRPTLSLRSTTSPGYSPELDALRALAIASVLLNHFVLPASILNRAQLAIQPGPPLGVPLFFSLSGFLITRILVQSRAAADRGKTTTGHSFYTFYARRFLRIFPLYYAALAFGAITNLTNVRHALPWHLSYLSNIYYFRHGFDHGPAPVFWTLSVEEQFYLVWPLMFLLMPIRWLPKFTLVTAAVGAVFAGWASMQPAWYTILTPAFLAYLALGSYLGLAGTAPLGNAVHQKKVMFGFLIAAGGVAAVTAAVHFALPDIYFRAEFQNGGRYVVSALVFSWIVARLSRGVGGVTGRVLRFQPMVYIGRISYGIYVLQFFVTQTMDRAVHAVSMQLGTGPALWLLHSFPMRMIAIVGAASASFLLFEKPINDLKRFFPYSRSNTTGNRKDRDAQAGAAVPVSAAPPQSK